MNSLHRIVHPVLLAYRLTDPNRLFYHDSVCSCFDERLGDVVGS